MAKSGSSLSDLLAAGVLQSVVQWIVEDKDPDDFYGYVRRRFPDANPSTVKAAINRGLAAYSFGQSLEDPSELGTGVLSNIPVNPDRPAKYGKPRLRFQYRVTVEAGTQGGNTRYITVFVQSGTILSSSQVRDKASELAEKLWAQENVFGSDPVGAVSTMQQPIIVSAERRY